MACVLILQDELILNDGLIVMMYERESFPSLPVTVTNTKHTHSLCAG